MWRLVVCLSHAATREEDGILAKATVKCWLLVGHWEKCGTENYSVVVKLHIVMSETASFVVILLTELFSPRSVLLPQNAVTSLTFFFFFF